MIDLVLHNTIQDPAYDEQFFRRICDAAEPYLEAPAGYTVEVGIALIDPGRMRELNREHRGKDASTDVLSFPLPTAPITGYTSISLGDLFISPSDVAGKAAEAGRDVREQMAWTVVHGLLHLAGHDHEISDDAARAMFALEQEILKKVKA
jgi:probable rRNA maturation factor